jgi:SPP1 family predicted phage head-tail adaptor
VIVSSLNKRIIIEKGTSATTSVKSPKLIYSEYMQTYANVYVRSASARFGESEELLFTTEFTIRYTSKSKEINNKYRIKYNDQIYKIIEVVETESRQALKIIAEHWYSDGQ